MESAQRPYVGYIVISRETPVRENRIYANITDDSIKEGDLVSIITSRGELLAIGIITKVEIYSIIDSFEHASLSIEGLKFQQITKPHLFRKATIDILMKLEGFSLSDAYAIRLPTESDIENLWKRLIPDTKKRILAGFLKGHEPLPAYYHADYLIGPEGAHLNIGGISGLAAKTSYLRFLIYSLLEYMEKTNEEIYIIVFNVKRLDFLGLHNVPEDIRLLREYINIWGKKIGYDEKVLQSYEKMYEYIFNVIRNYKNKIKYYTYKNDRYRNNYEFMSNPQVYLYGFQDLGLEGLIAGLFEEEDEASILQINLVSKIFNEVMKEKVSISLNDLKVILDYLRRLYLNSQQKNINISLPNNNLVRICNNVYQEALPDRRTIEAVIRRFDGFLDRTQNILDRNLPTASPIKAEGFVKGVNVIQLYGLNDIEKRVVVTSVVSEILRYAEESQRRNENRAFVIMMDELNKYAPISKSPVKKSLIEIAARGRDLMISLFGAEQFPSEVDNQVIGNMQTLVIGRMSQVELEDRIYRVYGELKNISDRLGKGEILVHHYTYYRPLMLLFPPPLNVIIRESK
jgi:DNA helicase HerA-like ATPase